MEDNLQDYTAQLKTCTEGSFLEGLDDFNIEVMYRELAVNSVAFMLMARCGVDTAEYFDREDFGAIVNFNTPQTLNAIGIATSDIAEMALRKSPCLSEMCKSQRKGRTAPLHQRHKTAMIQADNNPKGAKIMSEITYTKQGDYLIPDLTLPTEQELPLGRYALMHRDYLEKHKRVTYLNLLTSGRLNEHLHQTEQTALTRLELLTKQISKEQGVTEELKEKAPMQWVQMMNNIRSQAEKIIMSELIYS